MKKSLLIKFFLAAIFLSSSLLYALPQEMLPLDSNDGIQIGTGQLSVIFGDGSFNSYDVTDTTLTVLMIKMEVISVVSYGNQPGLGSIQLYNGTQQIHIDWVAAGITDWFGIESPDTWHQVIEGYAYAITRAAYNGNAGSAGAGNMNYTFPASGVGSINYYCVGFETPVTVTDINLGTGTNSTLTYDLTFFSFGEQTVIPEPTSILLLGSAMITGFIKYLRLRK